MTTIEKIKGRCRMEPGERDDHEHWIWTGAYSKSGSATHTTPMCWSFDIGKLAMRVQSVPRALWQIINLEPIPRGWTPRQTGCTVPGCVNPECWDLMTNKQYGLWQKRTRFLAGRPVYFESNKKTWDTRGRKVSHEVAQKIAQQAHRTGKELAAEFGIDPSTANKYKVGMLGMRARVGMFSGLLR